jgi:hypothetical protein
MPENVQCCGERLFVHDVKIYPTIQKWKRPAGGYIEYESE